MTKRKSKFQVGDKVIAFTVVLGKNMRCVGKVSKIFDQGKIIGFIYYVMKEDGEPCGLPFAEKELSKAIWPHKEKKV